MPHLDLRITNVTADEDAAKLQPFPRAGWPSPPPPPTGDAVFPARSTGVFFETSVIPGLGPDRYIEPNQT